MLKQLNQREKIVIGMGLTALALILFVYGCVSPLLESRERSIQQAIAREKELLTMMAYQDEYDQLQKENRRTAAILKKRPADFSLFSLLDKLAGSAGIKNKIIYMKPSTVKDSAKTSNRSRVEIKLDEITLNQIIQFLYHIETSPHLISVPRLSIKQKQQETGFLETVLQVETIGT